MARIAHTLMLPLPVSLSVRRQSTVPKNSPTFNELVDQLSDSAKKDKRNPLLIETLGDLTGSHSHFNANAQAHASARARSSDKLFSSTTTRGHSAKATAESLKLTGPLAGCVVSVHKGDINRAYRQLKGVVNANNIRGEAMMQRFHMKPGKVLEMKRIKRKKKTFDEGIRRLMDLVKEAKRRGY